MRKKSIALNCGNKLSLFVPLSLWCFSAECVIRCWKELKGAVFNFANYGLKLDSNAVTFVSLFFK